MTRRVFWHMDPVESGGTRTHYRLRIRFAASGRREHAYEGLVYFSEEEASTAGTRLAARLRYSSVPALCDWSKMLVADAERLPDDSASRARILNNASDISRFAEELLGKPERRGVAS
ncbi:MAG: hypothetical protein AAGG47_21350 [Pseudomonadota bacterium]